MLTQKYKVILVCCYSQVNTSIREFVSETRLALQRYTLHFEEEISNTHFSLDCRSKTILD